MSTPNLAIFQVQASQNNKEVTANTALDDFDVALTDLKVYGKGDFDETLTNALSLQHMVFELTGALTATSKLYVPTNKKLYAIKNNTTGGHSVIVRTVAGTGITLIAGSGFYILYCDGVNVVLISTGMNEAFVGGLIDTPSTYLSAGGYAVQVNPATTALEFSVKPCDVFVFSPGLYTNAQVLLATKLGRTVLFKAGLPGSYGKLVSAATASCVFSLKKNGTQFGTITFSAGGTAGTLAAATDTTFSAGDLLSILGPATADATAANLGVTLVGIRV